MSGSSKYIGPIVRLRRKCRLASPLARNLVSELFCTFLHMYIGFSVNAQTILSRLQMNSHLGISLGWGFALIFAVQGSYALSGSHLNPAVSFFVYSFGKLPLMHCIFYSIAQTIGAFLGAMLTFILYYEKLNEFDGGKRQIVGPNATAGIFATYPGAHLSVAGCIIDQISCTATLCVIIGIITDERNRIPRWLHPTLFGVMLTTISLGFGLNAGNAMNPARDFGPRLFTYLAGYGWDVFSYRDYKWFAVPIVCPLIGALVGSWLYQLMLGIHIPDSSEGVGIGESSGSEANLLRLTSLINNNTMERRLSNNGMLVGHQAEITANVMNGACELGKVRTTKGAIEL